MPFSKKVPRTKSVLGFFIKKTTNVLLATMRLLNKTEASPVVVAYFIYQSQVVSSCFLNE